jgi:Protein of unknown function (DUF3039)
VHSRRARPTLRLLAQDLTAGWDSPRPLRLLAEGHYESLHPVSELPHPIIAKATESFGLDPADDNYVGPIVSSTKLRLLEIKIGQWRGGVWEDPATSVRWLVVAGLAKGEHQDRDDFYQRIQRENDGGDADRWLPTREDEHLLKQETAARLITEWELAIQKQVLDALRHVHAGGSTRFVVEHPVPNQGPLARLTLVVTPVREPAYEADEIEVEIVPITSYAGSHLAWQLTLRALISLSPPEQGWDRYKDSFTNIADPGAWTTRVSELEALVAEHDLAESEPGRHSHYAHRQHLAGSTIEGRAVRALCGAFFVPVQDHDKLPRCPQCRERHAELPKQ